MSDIKELEILDNYKYHIETRLSTENKILSRSASIQFPNSFLPFISKYGRLVDDGLSKFMIFDRLMDSPITKEDWPIMLAIARNIVTCIARCCLEHNLIGPCDVPVVKEGWNLESAEEVFVYDFFIFRFVGRSMNTVGILRVYESENKIVLLIDDLKKAYWSIFRFLPNQFHRII